MLFLITAALCYRFYDAMKSQPRSLLMQQNGVLWTGHCLVLCGTMLVATSYWALGFYGTFLGMSFGCLLSTVCWWCIILILSLHFYKMAITA